LLQRSGFESSLRRRRNSLEERRKNYLYQTALISKKVQIKNVPSPVRKLVTSRSILQFRSAIKRTIATTFKRKLSLSRHAIYIKSAAKRLR